jgi:hypothetical protein
MKHLKIFVFLLIMLNISSNIVLAKTIGIGASPMKIEVGLGNETNVTNNIQYDFTIYNTGEMRTRVTPEYIDANMKNFSRPLINEIIIQPNSTEKFPVMFFRNGTGYKSYNGTLRFVAEPNETIESGMFAVRPATDIRISILQMTINPPTQTNNNKLLAIILAVVVIVFMVLVGWFITSRRK